MTEQNTKSAFLPERLIVSQSPHIWSEETTQGIMLDVVVAMVPAMIAAVYFFGLRAALLLVVSVASCVASEYLFNSIMKKKQSVSDLSAVVTGVLLAFNVPATMPIWQVIFGGVFAIIVVKMVFGGLGANFMNPALAARAMLMSSWPTTMTNYVKPFDLMSSATPLSGGSASLFDAFMGNMAGVIGETSALAILLGLAYLLIRKVITWEIPVLYIATTALCLLLFGTPANEILLQVLSGGLLLGAVFMATDYTTSPVTFKGRVIFAVGCGLLTALIRAYGGYPEGVSYSILLMNCATPLIDKYVTPKVFGTQGAKK